MTVSTHVLDTSAGRPAAGIRVRLLGPDGVVLAEQATNADGRIAALLPAGIAAEPGEYRLLFDVGVYFTARGQDAFYTTIQVAFVARDGSQHYHVPLLLSPFGYSTYRGT